MRIKPFLIERYFAQYEFSVKHLLSASDCESLSLQDVLNLADAEGRNLWDRLSLGYTESQGHPKLRQQIAQLYQNISSDQLLVAAPQEAIFLTMTALLKAGDHAIVTFPGYQSLYQIAEDMGCKLTRWELKPAGIRWTLDLDFLKAHIGDQTKLLVINFPHNPTGFVPSREEWDGILDLARQHDLILFSDEMYWHLEQQPEDHLPAVCDCYEKGISLFGMSKTLSLPGLRIGWLATRNQQLMKHLVTQKDYTTICSSAPSEVLALITLRASDEIIAKNQELLRSNLQIARTFFAQYPHWFEWLEPQGSSVAFPKLRFSKFAVFDLCQGLLAAKSVMILPGDVFECPDHFRLGMGRKDFPQALTLMGEYLSSTV